VHLDLDVFGFDVFPLSLAELLERQDLLLVHIVCDCLGIEDERLGVRLDALRGDTTSQMV
jgi:hypothetical protein